ncbi:hypothetical protein AB1Y20_008953 [Prymnesium parvum]|uniref:Uncharacterized protein n=1 Tax=Prymnesium parvum TaxID=97485 RepID=A0AB34K3N9_PRYPA|mmetsp:Transcript_30049/g.75081  ORF Transcript_30049/g.75081 Transcript_30049/m.75081 type:complete len:244 (+) Transcript_30049:28-759(+)
MAAEPSKRRSAEDVLPKGAENMLAALLDGLERHGRPMRPLVRVVLVGNQHEKPGKWEKQREPLLHWLSAYVKELSGEKELTGLLLGLPSGWILLAEGLHEPVAAMLKALSAEEGQLFDVAKVIHQSEDIPCRAFSSWGSKCVSVARKNYAETAGDQLATMLGELVIGMIKIGQAVGPMGSHDLNKIDAWQAHFPEMPSNERVGQAIEHDDVPTLKDFLDIFETPVEISLQSDRVWPPERPMVY